jgi:hypothetical protein
LAKYKLIVEPDAPVDIQKATDWYNEQLRGLGSRFQKQVATQVNLLKKNQWVMPFDMLMCAACS